MRKFKFTLSIGYANAEHSDVFEYEDDVTEEEVEEDYLNWRNNYLDGGFWELTND